MGAATGADDGAADDGVAVKTWEGWSDGRRVIVVGEGDEGARDGTVPCVGGCVVTAGCVGRGVGRGPVGERASVVSSLAKETREPRCLAWEVAW